MDRVEPLIGGEFFQFGRFAKPGDRLGWIVVASTLRFGGARRGRFGHRVRVRSEGGAMLDRPALFRAAPAYLRGGAVAGDGAAFAAGKFIAVGAGGTLLTSADGTTWTAVASQTTRDLRALAFGASTIVAVGAAGTVITSPDAATWTARPAIGAADLAAVAFGSQFVAVGRGGAIFTSADAVTWTAQSSGTTNDLNAVASGNFGYLAVGAAGTNLTAY